MSEAPKITIAFPLYRSARFLDRILDNIDRVSRQDVEFLLSDRHLADDALPAIRSKYADDPRVRCLAGNDELDWVAHMNLLLREARGRYFMLAFHDDTYLDGCVEALESHLDEHPDVVLAFGRRRNIGLDDLPVFPEEHAYPVAQGTPWNRSAPYRMFQLGCPSVAFRGLCRRRVVLERELWIRPTKYLGGSDALWVFGLGLVGTIGFVDRVVVHKRHYRDSYTSANSKSFARRMHHYLATMLSYVRSYDRGPYGYAMFGRVVLWVLLRGARQRLRPAQSKSRTPGVGPTARP